MSQKQTEGKTEEQPISTMRTVRDYAEAFSVALVLAFIFKAFVLEAYMIPTGSMASTLMGRHKDVNCEICGYPFQVGASQEVMNSGDSNDRVPRVVAGTCPQCNFTMYLGKDNTANQTYMSFNGDRIFVNKYVFDFRQPKRWHVTVFRYPANPYTNYIKRLVGVENETLRICNGDILVKRDGETDFKIQRKPLRALSAILRPVHDNDYVYAPILKLGYPANWYGDETWKCSDDYKSFNTKKSSAEDVAIHWLKYRNVQPSVAEWTELLNNKLPESPDVNNPMLVTDFLAYDSDLLGYGNWKPKMETVTINRNGKKVTLQLPFPKPQNIGQNWVGDLALTCNLSVHETSGSVTFRLIKGGIAFECQVDLATGRAAFTIPEVPDFPVGSAVTPITKPGNYEITFYNIDEQLRLVVDGTEINFQGKGDYDALCLPGSSLARDRCPTAADLEPAAIGVSGSAALTVEHLKVQRDGYYVSCRDMTEDTQCDLEYSPFADNGMFPPSESKYRKLLMSPERWGHFGKTRTTEFKLGAGQFLMLGDNSLQSKDSRLWTSDGIPFYVDRKFLIGEAIFVYWGHGLRIPGTNIALIPNVSKMRWID